MSEVRTLDGNGSPLRYNDEFNGLDVSDSDLRISRWAKLVHQLNKNDWDNLRRRIQRLIPDEYTEVFNQAYQNHNILFTDGERKKFYSEFTKLCGVFGSIANFDIPSLQWTELYVLIQKLGVSISEKDLKNLANAKMKSEGETFDFPKFVSLMCDVRKYLERSKKKSTSGRAMLEIFKIPIDPDSGPKQAWDLFSMVLLLYCSFSIPFSVAFLNQGNMPEELQDFDLLVDSLFMLDILLSFVTWYDDKGYIVRNPRQIALHYLYTWFLPDLAGSFPFDRVLDLVLENQPGMSSTNLIRILKFLRMMKLIRAVRFVNKLNRLKQKEGFEQFGNAIGVMGAMFLVLFVAHLLGCCFTMLLDPSGENWLDHYNPALSDADVSIRYETALYWAIITITTMGYGDVLPVTNSERMFVIFVAVVGAVVFSYCMGTISSLVSQYSNADDYFRSKLRTVAEYLQYRNVPDELRRKVRSFYSLSYRRAGGLYDEGRILAELSEPLRAEVLREIGSSAVSSLPLFHGFDERDIGVVFVRMRLSSLVKGQMVYENGKPGSEMYFIAHGGIVLFPNGDRKPEGARVLTSGDVFGETALFPCGENAVLMEETAEATAWTMVYSISSEDMLGLEIECPQVNILLQIFNVTMIIKPSAGSLLPSSLFPEAPSQPIYLKSTCRYAEFFPEFVTLN